ncbi:hypothetical protein Anapl_00045 [Anas platyrhynchos]|uniref:Uncharacterized protein n=1 Tax=Anas platyrhynchos TaxID=8839 RepID=R0LQ03_ANAPL|nr:hypothetical protein Anapl_00045 [Anas platyrhynchos]
MPRLICCTRELPDGKKAMYFKSVAVLSEACCSQRGMAVARSCVQLRKCHLPGLFPACSAGLAKKGFAQDRKESRRDHSCRLGEGSCGPFHGKTRRNYLGVGVTPAQILGLQHATKTRAACDSSWPWSSEPLMVKSEDGAPEVTSPCVVTATNRWPKLLEHPHVMHPPRSHIVVQWLGTVKDNIKSCWPPGWGERKGVSGLCQGGEEEEENSGQGVGRAREGGRCLQGPALRMGLVLMARRQGRTALLAGPKGLHRALLWGEVSKINP